MVLIHCMLPTGLGVIACALARFAVPLFFMVSGYYLRRDDMTNAQVHERMCLKVKRFGGLLLNDFTAIGGHLWFIAALLCCYGLFRYAGCKWLDKCGGSVAAILLGVHIVGRGVLAIRGVDSIGGIPAYLWLRNGAFMGLPFVALGDWIRRNQVRLTERLTK